MEQTIKTFSVSAFVAAVSGYLEQGLGMVAVQGEVSGFNVNRGQLVFFELKDKKARVKCFMMAHELKTPVEDGMEVRVMGTPKLFQTSGQFHVRVVQVEPVGAGALKRAYELLKQKLEAEGLFAPERKRALPRFPEHIGVVTSEDAAAWTDVQRVLHNRWPLARVTLAHVGVQGQRAVGEIVGAVRWLNESQTSKVKSQKSPEVIILTRGGGSLEDLQAFNSEDVVRAVFGSTIPVVCGVGHERDETLADYAADVRAATPSNAAELVVPSARDVAERIEYSASHIAQGMMHRLARTQHTLHAQITTLHDAIRVTLRAPAEIIERFFVAFEQFRRTLAERRIGIGHIGTRLAFVFAHRFITLRDALTAQERLLKTLSPQATLARGYTITMRNGTVVQRATQLAKGDIITTRFTDGEKISNVS